MEDYQWTQHKDAFAPVFKSQYDSFFLMLKNLNYSTDSNKNHFNDGLNESEKELLTLIAIAPGEIQDWYSEKTGFSIAKVQRIIKSLKDKGIIYRQGSKKKGTWRVKGVSEKLCHPH